MADKKFALDPRVDVAIRKAAEYARYLGSSVVTTEHLMLGCLCNGHECFRQAPNTTIRSAILDTVQHSKPIDPSQELPFALGAVTALRLPHLTLGDDQMASMRELRPEHVLIAILTETDSVAAGVLRSFGIASSGDVVFESPR